MKIQIKCVHCGIDFLTEQARLQHGRGKFCSKPCANESLKKAKTHGHVPNRRQSPTYITWVNMVRRCTKPGHDKFHRYGAIGITVCEKWLVFEGFLEDMGERPDGCTIDRVDGSLGYFKENCRWANIKEQQRNLKSNVFINYNGLTKCVSEWAEIHGIDKTLLAWRMRKGWTPEQALTTKPKKGNRIKSAPRIAPSPLPCV